MSLIIMQLFKLGVKYVTGCCFYYWSVSKLCDKASDKDRIIYSASTAILWPYSIPKIAYKNKKEFGKISEVDKFFLGSWAFFILVV